MSLPSPKSILACLLLGCLVETVVACAISVASSYINTHMGAFLDIDCDNCDPPQGAVALYYLGTTTTYAETHRGHCANGWPFALESPQPRSTATWSDLPYWSSLRNSQLCTTLCSSPL